MCHDAGLPSFYSNDCLRSTSATKLYQNNIDEPLIQEITGHRSLAIHSHKRTSDKQHKMAINYQFECQASHWWTVPTCPLPPHHDTALKPSPSIDFSCYLYSIVLLYLLLLVFHCVIVSIVHCMYSNIYYYPRHAFVSFMNYWWQIIHSKTQKETSPGVV